MWNVHLLLLFLVGRISMGMCVIYTAVVVVVVGNSTDRWEGNQK